ncbi:IS630 family transposase [Kitasatospora sp. NPDC094016]|uniref:IS630 family transposase n=1 Tax=Kitasatospora sp. NPDC094016 TaxID=3154986 RepID=UPI0033192DA7
MHIDTITPRRFNELLSDATIPVAHRALWVALRRRGPKLEPLLLSVDERAELERWIRRATSAQALALRSRIVLACAGPEVPAIVVVARELGIAADTVRKWRRRFLAERLDGLVDEPRPGRPPTIAAEEVEAVIVATLEEIPKNATHWSRSSMADRSGLSKSTIGRIWRKFQLKPHLTSTFKLSTDPLFVEKVYDVVGLHFNPPQGAVVLSVDEKSQTSPCPDRTPGPGRGRGRADNGPDGSVGGTW